MGVLVATIAGIAWVINELIDLPHGNALILYWNSMVRVMLFLIVAYLLSSLRQQAEFGVLASATLLLGWFAEMTFTPYASTGRMPLVPGCGRSD